MLIPDPATWPRDEAGTAYPPAPWALQGTLHFSLWRVPLAEIPFDVPAGLRPTTWGANGFLMTAWAVYTPGGVLTYNEMLVAVPVFGTGLVAPATTVARIWVDDAASIAGARAMWDIPKEMGLFETRSGEAALAGAGAPFAASLQAGGAEVADFRFEPGAAFPLPPRVSFWTVQAADCGLNRTRCTAQGTLRSGRGLWRFAPDGPLGFLAGRQPVRSARLERASLRFGA